jgi:aryl-alcohol dehydrogenase-like predicted oxidoreductase
LRDLSGLDAKDIRRSMGRFQPDNYTANLKLQDAYAKIAQQLGCSQAQLALAWVIQRAPHIIAIPGTTNAQHMQDNFAASSIHIPADLLQQLDALINSFSVKGARYDAQSQSEVDTESLLN